MKKTWMNYDEYFGPDGRVLFVKFKIFSDLLYCI